MKEVKYIFKSRPQKKKKRLKCLEFSWQVHRPDVCKVMFTGCVRHLLERIRLLRIRSKINKIFFPHKVTKM